MGENLLHGVEIVSAKVSVDGAGFNDRMINNFSIFRLVPLGMNSLKLRKKVNLLPFLDLAVAKSVQSTRTVTDADDDDADDVLTTTGYTC